MPAPAGNTPCNDLPDSTKYAKYKGDICITGMSGRVGQCKNLDEFKDILMKGKDAFTDKSMRFDIDKYGTQKEHAYFEEAEKFDNDYFGIAPKNAEFMDPNIRLSMEAAYEAVVDSGYSMQEVRGTLTGVYASVCTLDASNYWLSKTLDAITEASKGLGVIHNFRASRVSYAMDLRGPSMCVDTACAGYLSAIEAAVKDIRLGNCDRAIVVTSQLEANPMSEQHFMDLGLSGPNSKCFSFDERAEGFARGEAMGAIMLHKEEEARRIYAKVAHGYQSCDGNSGDFALEFSTPSFYGQIDTLKECYRQAGVDPQTIEFVECHGLGTKVGDTTEANAITEVFCGKQRTKPLIIGSVKTNAGHADAAAGFNATIKCVMALNEGVIPPNLNFEKPNKEIPGLHDGRLKVPVEPTPWSGNMCGISAYSYGGTNTHLILKKNERPNKKEHPASQSPRLFTYGARTEEGLQNIMENVHKNAHNVGYQALLESSGNESVQKMPFRGFSIVNSQNNITEIKPAKKRPIVFCCTGMGCQWDGAGKKMMEIPLFRESVQKNCEILKRNHGVDVYDAIKNGTAHLVADGLGSWCSIPVLQMALVDMMMGLGIKPDYIIGHSLGEVASAYADGCLNREEAMLVPICRWFAAKSTPKTLGQMAVVGITPEDLAKILPADIDFACHNAEDSLTISGPTASVKAFVADLDSKNIFAKEVDSIGVAFHSRLIKHAEGEMRRLLTEGGLKGKARSSKWLSSAYAKHEWELEECKVAGIEYFTHNYVNRVRFFDVASMLPKDSVIIEIAPSGLLQSTLKSTLGSTCMTAALMKRSYSENISFFMESLGNLYINGVDMTPLGMFEKFAFPAPQETPMLSPMISKQWNHTETFRVPSIEDMSKGSSGDVYETTFDCSETGNARFLNGHMVNGVKMFPVAGYLKITWEALSAKYGQGFDKTPVVFENVQIIRATKLVTAGKMTFRCRIRLSGEFELTESDQLVMKGKICQAKQAPKIVTEFEKCDAKIKAAKTTRKTSIPQTKDEIYRSLVNKGLDYSGMFRGIINTEGNSIDIEWTRQWIPFIDFHLQAGAWMKTGDSHITPLKMDAMYLDAYKLHSQITFGVDKPVMKVLADPNNMNYITSDVLKIKNLSWDNACYQPSGDGTNASLISQSKRGTVKTAIDAYVSVPTVGNPSSATWVNTNQELLALNDSCEKVDDKYVTVYYTSVNDRDILQANGKIPKTDDLVWRFNRGFYGYEFAGKSNDGSRVVGLVPGLALATGLNQSRGLVFNIPEKWTMKDAATVPYCYLSVYYALVVKKPLIEGQTILVHSGATAMGTAAISTALHVGATVYTTVYSDAEMQYLTKCFPKLPPTQIIVRRQAVGLTTVIDKLTGDQGVNVVLSPNADESLFEESYDCLSKSGQYIEIGRPVTSAVVEEFAGKLNQKHMTYTRVDAMVILNDKASHKRLSKSVSDAMEKGVINPISATVFEAKDISKAFKEASASHVIGKVLVQIREEKASKPVDIPVTPCVTCDPKKVYVLCGGLEGFGLELAQWLVQRGARNAILTSGSGITTGYQEYKTKMLKENYKANIKIKTIQLKSTTDAKALLQEAQQMGPIGGIFANDTNFLNEASKELCGPELDWFVPFSSIVSGLGNAQSN